MAAYRTDSGPVDYLLHDAGSPQRDRVAAAAHLFRYYADERAGESYRGLAEIRWLVFWPQAPEGNKYTSDATQAAAQLMAACLRQFGQWHATCHGADGDLPVLGVYGVLSAGLF
jgi:mono/diheme cytochrome c family protein